MEYSIVGRLIDEQGRPISDAYIVVLENPGIVPDMGALTNSRGAFSFHHLTKGKTILRISTDEVVLKKQIELVEQIQKVNILIKSEQQ